MTKHYQITRFPDGQAVVTDTQRKNTYPIGRKSIEECRHLEAELNKKKEDKDEPAVIVWVGQGDPPDSLKFKK
jgi:hypothetical protein